MFSFRQAQPSSDVDASSPGAATETPSHDVDIAGDSKTATADPPIDKPVVTLLFFAVFVFAPWIRSTHSVIPWKETRLFYPRGTPNHAIPVGMG